MAGKEATTLRPKNWAKFQHYKDRSPPWIKLHREILDDFDFACLPVASKALAPLLWLLAAEETNGHFTGEIPRLAHRLRWPEQDLSDGLLPLIDKGFFEVASGSLAVCEQHACPEAEAEAEGKTDICASGDAPPTKSDSIPYQAIVDQYNATMTGLAKVRVLTAKRRTAIRSVWQASDKFRSERFFEAFFAECQEMPFLNGTGPYTNGHENWLPDFDYLMQPKVATRVYEKAMQEMEAEDAH